MIKAIVIVYSLKRELGYYSLASHTLRNCVRLLRVTFQPQFSSHRDERYISSYQSFHKSRKFLRKQRFKRLKTFDNQIYNIIASVISKY